MKEFYCFLKGWGFIQEWGSIQADAVLNKAKSDFRAKSQSKAPFEITHCQNATNTSFSIEDLRNKKQLVLQNFSFLHHEGPKTYFHNKTLIL